MSRHPLSNLLLALVRDVRVAVLALALVWAVAIPTRAQVHDPEDCGPGSEQTVGCDCDEEFTGSSGETCFSAEACCEDSEGNPTCKYHIDYDGPCEGGET